MLHTITSFPFFMRRLTVIFPWEPHAAQPLRAFSNRLERIATKSMSAIAVCSGTSAVTETAMPSFCVRL